MDRSPDSDFGLGQNCGSRLVRHWMAVLADSSAIEQFPHARHRFVDQDRCNRDWERRKDAAFGSHVLQICAIPTETWFNILGMLSGWWTGSTMLCTLRKHPRCITLGEVPDAISCICFLIAGVRGNAVESMTAQRQCRTQDGGMRRVLARCILGVSGLRLVLSS